MYIIFFANEIFLTLGDYLVYNYRVNYSWYMNLEQQYDSFVKQSFEEKRTTVIAILDWVRATDSLFEDIYQLVVSDNAIEQDFYDIYESLMTVLYREELSEENSARKRVEQIRDTLQIQKECEQREQEIWKKEAEWLLDTIL